MDDQQVQPASSHQQVTSDTMVNQSPATQSVVPDTSVQQPQQQTPISVGVGMQKERITAPLVPVSSEMVAPSESEPQLHPELVEIGVEHTKEVPQLTLEDQKAGLELAKESTLVLTEPRGHVTLPKTEQEVDVGLTTHKGTNNSIVWWFTLIKKQWKRLNESGKI